MSSDVARSGYMRPADPPRPPRWDVVGWTATPDRYRRVWIAEAVLDDGLTLRIEAETLAELRIRVEAHRGRAVTVP